MSSSRKVRFVLALAGLVSVSAVGLALLFVPPAVSGAWWTSVGVLSLLAIVARLLGIQITPGGSRTTFDFVVHLAAVMLVGPVGAAGIAGSTTLFHEVAAAHNPPRKILFNSAQITFSALAAGVVYLLAGGEPGLATTGYPHSLLPFGLAVITYSATNTAAVVGIVSAVEDTPFFHVWRNLKGPIALFDLTVSMLGYVVAAIYIEWGPLAIIVILVPLFGVRYLYGVNLALKHMGRDLIRVLVRTLEARDPYTSGHSLRVAEYAKWIGRELGLGYTQLHNLETAALLHDMGKIDRVYATILEQEGPLTDRQQELIRAHPDRAVQLLKTVRELDDRVLKGVRHHHERWDGTGYPEGLEGEEIPIEARIIMAADTIDAMLTSRSYRDALELGDVRRELQMYKAKQFDPEVVEAVFESGLLDEIDEEGLPRFEQATGVASAMEAEISS